MTLIQVALAAGVILIGAYMYVRLRSTLFDVFLIGFFILSGTLLVLFPEYSNKIAHWAGVGRGADLLFYLSILFLFFLIMTMNVPAGILVLIFTIFIIWSRVTLKRHTIKEIIAGAVLGLTVGIFSLYFIH